jgi:transposase-like protein
MTIGLSAPHFHDPDKAREYLESQVWPDGPVCPHCGSIKGKSNRPGLYKCKDCRGPFTVTVGTVFERSKVPLNKWLMASHLLSSSKKGCSANQLHRTLGVTYKTAWFMAHRIREAMREPSPSKIGGGGEAVVVDEPHWGNRMPRGQKKGRGYRHEEVILPLVQRGGHARSLPYSCC